MAGPLVSFLTDFGASTAPAVCRGVILGICPEARILDLTHEVRKFAIRDGAFLLSCSVPYLPVGVHLAVVDPGVGTARRPIAIRTRRGDLLVGPDNGLLRPAAEALGGISEARVLENRALWRDEVSTTFHGRDIFSPVTAHLASGEAFASVGSRVEPSDLVSLALPSARRHRGGLDTAVLFIDTFGNCRLAGTTADLFTDAEARPGDRFTLRLPDRELTAPWWPTFGDAPAGEVLLYEDADYAGLALAVNQGSAAEDLRLALDDPIRIGPA